MAEETQIQKVEGADPSKDVRVGKRSRTMFVSSATAPATKPAVPFKTEYDGSKVAPWGTNNLFPQTVYTEIKDSPVVQRALNTQAYMLYGGGMYAGIVTDVKDDGTEIFKPYKRGENKDWDEFVKRNPPAQYLMGAAIDWYYFGIPFPEIVMTKGSSQSKRKVYSIKRQKAMFCRFSKAEAGSTKRKVFISGEWNAGPGEPQFTVPSLDPFDNAIETVKLDDSLKSFIFPIAYPSVGEFDYPLLPWDSIRKTWLPISKLIPDIKMAMLKTGTVINYVIEVADWYWSWKFPDWKEKPELQAKRIDEVYDAFDEMMTGSDNAGKNIFLPLKTNQDTMEGFPGWKITPLEKIVGEGKWLDDTTEASLQMLTGIGLDPAILGIVPGKSMSAPGGSDKRVAFNAYLSMRQYDRDTILHPYYFIRDVNDWDPNMEFRFKYPFITTLDKGKETQQQTS